MTVGNFALMSAELEGAVTKALASWRASSGTRRLWQGDASLWSGNDESRWLGWLDAIGQHRRSPEPLPALAAAARAEGIAHVVVLGMGGSSLFPDVLARTFGAIPRHPRLLVLDSIVPAQVAALEATLDLASTWFIVASKSGSTTEPNVLYRHFRTRAAAVLGEPTAGRHFLAVTDPGSSLEAVARAEGFRAIVPGVKSIGGRFSALSNFGLLPAALMGVDVADFLDRAARMAAACGPGVAESDNPGVRLGIALGVLAKAGRDKLTIVTSPGISALGGWLEQLVAESTGKLGVGVVPIDGEALTEASRYGQDRVFVYTRLECAPDPEQDQQVAAIADAGHPVIRLALADERDLGQEIFRWEIATAVAGSILAINPFDQPDVEAAKIATRGLVSAFESEGALPTKTASLREGPLTLYANGASAPRIAGMTHLAAALRATFASLGRGDYFAVNAFLPMSPAHDAPLQSLRHAVRDAYGVATTLGYGPRFLHSTGQLHKGGPASGLFLQLTAESAPDLAIPGQKLSFGVLALAQALGDLAVLEERGRRIIRIDLGNDVAAGLVRLDRAVQEAIAS